MPNCNRNETQGPLIPTKTPPQDWTKLDADHWGPTDDGRYILVVVDETTKYAEAAVDSGTRAEPNIAAFDKIFSTQRYPEKLKTDAGPPFNGNENHELQEFFKWVGIDHKTTVSAVSRSKWPGGIIHEAHLKGLAHCSSGEK